MLSVCKMPNFKKEFDEDLKLFVNDVMNLIKYDIAKIIMLNYYDKNHILTKFSVYKNEKDFTQDEGKLINIDKDSTKSLFKLLLDKKEAIICSFPGSEYSDCYDNNQYKPFVENIKNEIYIPLSDYSGIDVSVIGCLYLGSYDADNFAKKEDLQKEEFIKNIRYIQEIYCHNYLKTCIEEKFLSITNIMDNMLMARTSFMNNHDYNVAYWSDLIANKLGFNSHRRHKLYISSLYHDIGKLYINESILNKKGKLTNDEYSEIKKHCEYGFQISKAIIPYSDDIPEIIKCHQERYDGNGYPNGLKGDEIPLESRIIAIADAVDSMLAYRTYRKPKKLEDVISELNENRGKQFDPEISDIMISILVSNSNYQKSILNAPIIIGAINIITKSKTYIIKGDLNRALKGYIFTAAYDSYEIKDIQVNEIDGIYFYTQNNETIYEYKVKFDSIIENKIYISDLTPQLSNDYFNILWDLDGMLELEEKNKIHIDITEISGNGLTFFVTYDLNINTIDENIYKLDISFENDEVISVTGKIVNMFEIGYKCYYVIRFVNLLEKRRDDIIKQIFMKQAALRRGLNINLYRSSNNIR